jgi:aminopeptidase N
MKKLIGTIIFCLCIQNTFAQILNDAEPHSCATHKAEMYKRINKKSRAGVYPNALMKRYDVKHYFLDLNAERNSTVISGSTTIKALLTAATDTFCFELNKNLVLDSIKYNNAALVFSRDANSITYAKFPAVLGVNTLVDVRVFYHGDANVAASAAIGSGFDTGTSGLWGNQATWSLSEPYSAVDWFACKQFLEDKADSATVHVTTDNQNKVASNGILLGVEPLPNNKVKYKWHTNYIIDYYLISIAVAKYVDYTFYAKPSALPNDSIKMMNYVYDNPNTLTTFKPRIDSIALFMNDYCNQFGLYPFWKEKYGNALAPFGGGMEHQTMTSIGNLSSMSTNTHELLHHWFGDYVTCKTWKDIYVNEGITSYGEVLTIEKYRPASGLVTKLTDLNDNITSQIDGSVYCPDTNNVGRIFSSRLSYDKGSMVTHTLRFELGDSLFFKTMRNYLSQYAFSNASILDLKQVAETTSGKNLTAFFNQWIFGEGHPQWSGSYYSWPTSMVVKINHQGSMASNNLYVTPLELKLLSPSGDSIVKVNITANSNTFVLPTKKVYTGFQIDPKIQMARTIGSITKDVNLVTGTPSLQSPANFEAYVVQNQLVIKNANFKNAYKAQIFNTDGKIVKTFLVQNAEYLFDISNFTPGHYILSTPIRAISFIKN